LYAPEIEIFGEANTLAGAACQAISPVLRKYPFNSGSNEDATIADVDSFLKKPDGHFWKLVNDDKLKPFITQFGDTFAAAPGRVQPKAAFIEFLNRASALSHVLYGPNGQLAGFKFTLSPVASPDVVEHVTLKIDGSTQSTDSKGNPTREFDWPGNGEGVTDVQVRFAGGSDFNFAPYHGLWGVWRFINNAENRTANQFELIAKSGKNPVIITTQKGAPEAVRFTIDPAKAPIFRPQYFHLVCVPKLN
jgi:type VI protein secretion system component VasK